MTRADEMMTHPPTMAEMAGGVLDNEAHAAAPVPAGHADEVPPGLAKLEAETEN